MRDMAALQAQERQLEPYAAVHDNEHVQRWVEEMNDTLVLLEAILRNGNYDTKEAQEQLKALGVPQPKSVEEELVLYRSFQLMLGFLKRKLDLLKRQSSNYEKTKRKIIELGTKADIGINRSVAR